MSSRYPRKGMETSKTKLYQTPLAHTPEEVSDSQGRIIVGYIPIDQDGKPYRSTKIVYGKETHNALRMYPSEKRAVVYSPVNKAVPLYADKL